MSSVGSDEEDGPQEDGPQEVSDNSIEEATEEEIIEYAEFIGIDPEREPHLMWIAEQGVGAPVPKPWKTYKEGDEEVWYFNPDTQESTWEHPCDAEFKALVEKYREAGPGAARQNDEDDLNSEVSEDMPSPTSTPASASAGRGDLLERGDAAAGRAGIASPSGGDTAAGDAAGCPVSPSAMRTSPTGAEADQDLANQSGSYLSDALDSDDMAEEEEETKARAGDGDPIRDEALRISPAGANEDTKSFISELVDDSDLADVAATSPTGADVAEEAIAKQPSSLSEDALREAPESAPNPSSPMVSQLSMKDAAAMWAAGAGGGTLSTPRSPPSSRSRSSTPRGDEPQSASSNASDAGAPAQAKTADVSATANNAGQIAGAKAALALKSEEPPKSSAVGICPSAGKPAVDPISSGPLDGNGVRKSPQASPSSGDRPPAVLDHVACTHSARSSNLSEVSEDFLGTPPATSRSARSGSGGVNLGADCSLEVSMSMDTEGAARSAGTGSVARSPPDRLSPLMGASPNPKLSAQRTWAQLQRELQVLAKALEGCRLVRSKQREYLQLLNINSLRGA